MWNNDHHILWNHIKDIYYEDQNFFLHLLPNLTDEHINFTPYSVMNVRLAAQVLSTSVSTILKTYRPADAGETAIF